MTTSTRVLVLVGSLRADSLNQRPAEALVQRAPEGVEVEIASGLGDVPFYNSDLDDDAAGVVPAAATALREQVAAADRLLVVTPEYNGGLPAVLGNVLDWTSRPHGAGAIKGKPVAVVGTSVGRFGGQWAHEVGRRSAGVAGADVVEDIVLNHRYAWGEDPVADDATVDLFVAALEGLVAYRPAEVSAA